MNTWQIIFSVVAGFVLFIPPFFYLQGKLSQKGSAPGLVNNQLQHCSHLAMNCVCTEYPDEKLWFQAPIVVKPIDNPLNKAVQIIEMMGGIVVARNDQYVASTFTSKLYQFVDDFELRLDAESQQLHIRSASRVGKHDADANKRRVARFKQLFAEA